MLNVLLIEDSESDAAMVVRSLRKAGYEIQFEQVDTAAAMQIALEKQAWDVVISDYSLPQFSVEAALVLLKKTGLDIPFIVVSGTIGEETAVAMMKAGAHDYVMKDRMARLAPAVEREIKEARDRHERRLVEEKICQSENKLRALFAAMIDVILVIDSEGRYLEIAPTNPTNLYRPSQDLLGKTVTELFSVDLADLFLKTIHRSLQTKEPTRVEYSLPIGEKDVWFAAMVSPLSSDSVIWVAHDITERKRSEMQINRQLDYLNALRAIDTVITSSFNLHISLDFILKQAVAVLAVDAADILIYNPFDRTLECTAGRGLRIPLQQRTRLRMGQGYAGQAVLHQRQVFVQDVSLAGGGLTQSYLPAGENIVFYCGIPLVVKGQVKGVLEIMHRSFFHPDEEWKKFAEALASQAAIAVDSLELFDKIQQLNLELVLAYDSTLEGLGQALDYRLKEKEGHTSRVTEMSLDLARALGLSDKDQVNLRRGALLHDIGMLGISESLLLKPGALSEEERSALSQHPQLAYTWLSRASYLRSSLDIPYCHHEQWDGNGYPRRIKEENIPMAARLFAIVHMWDVLQADRPYRKAWPREKVVQFLWQQSGALFDPAVVKAFFATFKETRF